MVSFFYCDLIFEITKGLINVCEKYKCYNAPRCVNCHIFSKNIIRTSHKIALLLILIYNNNDAPFYICFRITYLYTLRNNNFFINNEYHILTWTRKEYLVKKETFTIYLNISNTRLTFDKLFKKLLVVNHLFKSF